MIRHLQGGCEKVEVSIFVSSRNSQKTFALTDATVTKTNRDTDKRRCLRNTESETEAMQVKHPVD
jgi:hypothetical protein